MSNDLSNRVSQDTDTDEWLPSTARNPARTYLDRLGAETRRTMHHALDTIARFLTRHSAQRLTALDFPWGQLRIEHTRQVRKYIVAKYQATTVNKILAALRGVLRVAVESHQMSSVDFHHAVDLPAVKGGATPRRAISQDHVRAVFDVCRKDKTPAGFRDGALVTLLYAARLRRTEAAALDVADYSADTGLLTIRGEKERVFQTSDSAKQTLDSWLSVRESKPGPFLLPIDKTGRIVMRRLTPDAILKIIQKRGAQAGIRTINAEDLRRAFVSTPVQMLTIPSGGHAGGIRPDQENKVSRKRHIKKTPGLGHTGRKISFRQEE